MTRTRHIVLTWMLSLMLSLTATTVWAQDNAEMSGLHCGDVVTITATPDSGYRFVRWSDGNTDNPREIEITDAVNLTAEYAPLCYTDTVPVVWLYNQLMMLNVDSLQRMGYTFSGQDVNWYRIVGDIDTRSSEENDQLLGSGYFYNLEPYDYGTFYAAVDVGDTPEKGDMPRCSDRLYSLPIYHGASELGYITDDQSLSLVPNYGPPGTIMQILGLSTLQHYTIQVYDAVGRKLEEYTSSGEQQYTITAQQIPGYYLVRVTSKEGKSVLRYVVKQ